MAAEELRSPVILAHYVNTGAYSGHEMCIRDRVYVDGSEGVF